MFIKFDENNKMNNIITNKLSSDIFLRTKTLSIIFPVIAGLGNIRAELITKRKKAIMKALFCFFIYGIINDIFFILILPFDLLLLWHEIIFK